MGERYSQYSRLLCPICGSAPKLDEIGKHSKKVFCSGNGIHISCGDWKRTKGAAWADWARRRVDKSQPDFWYKSNATAIFGPHNPSFPRDNAKVADFLRRVQSGEFQLPEGMTWETWLDYPADGKFPAGYPSE